MTATPFARRDLLPPLLFLALAVGWATSVVADGRTMLSAHPAYRVLPYARTAVHEHALREPFNHAM
ncbi:MAG TPA: hypothetical protein VEI02_09430, partial [Planctomycetota bacterium]|nr:hypothetical protein [Planctomycetota bacterium]